MGRIRQALTPAFLVLGVALWAAGAQAAHPGALDTSFGTHGKTLTSFTTGDDEADSVFLQPDGKIVAAGYASVTSGTSVFALSRYKPNGRLDTSFGSGGKVTTAFPSGYALAIPSARQADGKIVAAGYTVTGADYDWALARYKPNGALDTSFGGSGMITTDFGTGISTARGMVIQPNKKIVVIGYAANAGNPHFALARYNPDGSLNATFGSGGKVTTAFGPYDVGVGGVLQPDGKIVAVGYSYVAPNYSAEVARYSPDGSLDTTFGTGGSVTTSVSGSPVTIGRSILLQPDGKLVVGGYTYDGTRYYFLLLRYMPDGSLDTTFGTGGIVKTAVGPNLEVIIDTALQPNGKIVVAGYSSLTSPPTALVGTLARYRPNGSLDTTFGSGGKVTTAFGSYDDFFVGTLVQPDGKIVAVGGSARSSAETDYDFALARYHGDTCVVPKVKGRKLAGAKRLIKRKTCAVGKVEKRSSKRVKKGRVISQKPVAGSKVASATPVNLVVSKGRRH